jgi:hypothetical protein
VECHAGTWRSGRREETGERTDIFKERGNPRSLVPPERTENGCCERNRVAPHLDFLNLRVHNFNRQQSQLCKLG